MRAFTLIELLIVIGIIAILALIAVPNFLEAQVRAKVARAIADMRTIATGLEAYCVDWGAYPVNDGQYNTTPTSLTTPVAFLTTSKLEDPFAMHEKHAQYGDAARWYTYGTILRWDGKSPLPVPAPPMELVDHDWFNKGASEKYGLWRMCSLGPDRIYSDFRQFGSDYPCYGSDIVYDASNGTMSWGNILRTQKHAAGAAGR